jgi:hypothetical protein
MLPGNLYVCTHGHVASQHVYMATADTPTCAHEAADSNSQG